MGANSLPSTAPFAGHRSPLKAFRYGVVLSTLILSIEARAQSNAPTNAERVGEETLIAEDIGLPMKRDRRSAELPESALPDIPEVRSRHAVTRILVRDLQLSGNTLLSQEQVDSALRPYRGKNLSLEEIQSAANRVTQQYVAVGYINSGAIIPDQDASDGLIDLKAIEGELTDIVIRGNQSLQDAYLARRIERSTTDALNIYELEETLLLLQEHPLIENLNARVIPGAARGDGILNLSVTEREPMALRLNYNNHRPPSVGEHQGVLSFAHNSLTGHGDYLYLNYALTEGLEDTAISYGLPLTAADLTLEAYYSLSNSDIVESPFDQLDILSEIRIAGARVYRPVVHSLRQKVVLGLAVENVTTQSSLAAAPFSFSPGEQSGSSEVSLIRLSAEWTWRRESDAVYTRAAISQGVDWLGATDNSDATGPDGAPVNNVPDSDFTSLLLQSSYVRALPWGGAQLMARLTAQASSDPLLPSQRLAVGGARSVRGYRENQLVRDTGLIGSVELRIPVFADDTRRHRNNLIFVPFVDFGLGKDKSIGLPGLDRPEEDTLLSLGAGLIWNNEEGVQLEVYYATRLQGVANRGGTLQEDGFHLQARYEWRF